MKKRFFLLLPLLFGLAACGRLDSISYVPAQTPETWLAMQPYASVGGIIIVQPSTSAIVYLLGLIAVGAGSYFLKIRGAERSRLWWGIALVLWGIGALLAGTSYEAFSYQIKCAGRAACTWTSWWEIAYLLVSVWSIDAITLAVAYSSTAGKLRKALTTYAVGNAALYFLVVAIGAFLPVKWMISFELLLAFSAPGIIAFFVVNGRRYLRSKERLDLLLSGAWLWLGATIAAYFTYLISGATARLWAQGAWFSENDVLHIGLIIWMLYIVALLAPHVTDLDS